MPLVRVVCGSCGKHLGSYVDSSGASFGIFNMQKGERTQVDPDCAACNPNYHKICKKCRATAIDKDGVCRVCKKVMKTRPCSTSENPRNQRNLTMTTNKPDPKRSPFSSCTCRRCSRRLTNPDSVKQGYGKTCYHKRMNGDPKQSSKFAEACTIVAPDLAKKVYEAIYRLIAMNKKYLEHTARWGCRFCHTTLFQMPVESMDHDSGLIMPGFGKPQWFILHDEHYDLAIWKIGITNDKILDEMEEHGDIPKGWTRRKV